MRLRVPDGVYRTISVLAAAAFLLVVPPSTSADPKIDDFLREADVRDMKLSPDGTHLAFVTNEDGKRSVVVRNIVDPDMPIVGAFSGDLSRPNFLYWANDDRLLIAMSIPYEIDKVKRDKRRKDDFDIDDYFMFSRMISVSKDMSDAVILMEDERGLRRNLSLSRVTNFLPNDANHVLMAAYRAGKRIQYRVDVTTGDSEKVTSGSRRTFRFFNDEAGEPRYRFDYLPRSKAIVLYEFTGDDAWKKVEKIHLNRDDEASIDTVDLVAFRQDDLVYRRQNEETGYYELIVVDSESGLKGARSYRCLTRTSGVWCPTGRPTSWSGTPLRKTTFGTSISTTIDSRSTTRCWLRVGDYNFAISDFSEGRGVALVRSWGPDDPGSYHLWDAHSQNLTFLAYAYEGLATAKLSVPGLATYKTRDGQSIRSYILFPKDYVEGEAYPTIVLPHGGPHARDRATYDSFAQFLSTRGYVVVQPNFRGSVGYGRDFEESGYRQWGGLMQDDLTDAVHSMVREGIADPDRICIVGVSYGGYAALMGAVKTPDLFKCAVSLNGVTHLVRLLEHAKRNAVDREDWQIVLFDRIGHPRRDREQLDANSPALHAGDIRIPILLVAGTDDTVVPIAQSRIMAKALKAADADYEFIELSGTGHNPFYYREDAETVYEAIEVSLARACSRQSHSFPTLVILAKFRVHSRFVYTCRCTRNSEEPQMNRAAYLTATILIFAASASWSKRPDLTDRDRRRRASRDDCHCRILRFSACSTSGTVRRGRPDGVPYPPRPSGTV